MIGAAVLHAQFLGGVSGTVTNPSGAIVPGALLTLKNQSFHLASKNPTQVFENTEEIFRLRSKRSEVRMLSGVPTFLLSVRYGQFSRRVSWY